MATAADAMSFIAAPWQIAVVAILAIGLFAPHLLPRIGRMLGRALRAEIYRRTGLAGSPARRQTESQAVGRSGSRGDEGHGDAMDRAEVLMPDNPAPTLRAQSDRPLAPDPPPTRSAPIWFVSGGFILAAAFVLWLLLHSR